MRQLCFLLLVVLGACAVPVSSETFSQAASALQEDLDSGSAAINGAQLYGASHAFSANHGAAEADDSAAFGSCRVHPGASKGFCGGLGGEVLAPGGAVFGQSCRAGNNAFGCGEDSFAYGFRSLACGQGAITHADSTGAIALGAGAYATGDFSTALGQASFAPLRTQLAFASGSFDGNTAFNEVNKGSAQWSTLVLRGVTTGSGTAYLTFGSAGDLFVRPGSADASYVVTDECVATTTSGNRQTRVHVERFLVEVVGGSASISAESSPLDIGPLSGTWAKYATTDGWFTTFSASCPVRVVCAEHWTQLFL